MIVRNAKCPPFPKGRCLAYPLVLVVLFAVVGASHYLPSQFEIVLSADSELESRFKSGGEILYMLLFLFVGGGILFNGLKIGNIRERTVVTRKTLSIQSSGEWPTFVKRHECVGISNGGYELLLEGGRSVNIVSLAASSAANEAFLKRLYALWWPELSLTKVRAGIEAPKAETSRLERAILALAVVVLALSIGIAIFYGVVWLWYGLPLALFVGCLGLPLKRRAKKIAERKARVFTI
jgi:general stress protein CsbA